MLNPEEFLSRRDFSKLEWEGRGAGGQYPILPEAAGGNHYCYLHNLFLLRMLPNIIYKISVGNALAAEQCAASEG